MTADQIERAVLAVYALRIDPATAEYAAEQFELGRPFAVYAGCARTGRPVHQTVTPADLVAATPAE